MSKIELDSFLSYRFLSEPTYSPSGNMAAYLSHSPCLAKNNYESSLWVCDMVDGGERRISCREDIQSFLWIDDTSLLISVKSKKFESKLSIVDLCGEEREFAHLPCQISLAGRLKDGRIVLTVDEAPDRLHELLHKTGEEREKAICEMEQEDAHFRILDEYPFWFNGKGFISGLRRGIYLLDNGELVPITPSGYRVEGMALCEDRTRIVYFGNEFTAVQPDTHQLCVYSADDGKTSYVYPEGSLRFSRVAMDADGRLWAAARIMDEVHPVEPCERLFVSEPDGTLKRADDGEWSFGNAIGSDCRYGSYSDFIVREGKLWFIATVFNSSQVFCCEPGKAPFQCTELNGSVDGIDVKDGQILAVAMKDTRLQELYVKKHDSDFIQITNQNSRLCDDLNTVLPKEVTFVNSCSMRVHGFVLEPVGYVKGNNYPAILDIHGGPHTAYGNVFYHEMQYWANSGYYVIYCNPRGSAGRGDVFGDIRGNWGGIDYEDIMEFVDTALNEFPDIDRTRLGVTGGSYGGYMTNWIIGHTDRFKAAATQRSLFNLISDEGTSDCGMRFRKQHLNLAEGEDPMDKLWNMSPAKYIENAVTPTLIIHSEEDKRCWYAEGLQLFTALKQNGVEARMVLFKGENHELSRSGKPRNRIKRLKEITEWMNRFLKHA